MESGEVVWLDCGLEWCKRSACLVWLLVESVFGVEVEVDEEGRRNEKVKSGRDEE